MTLYTKNEACDVLKIGMRTLERLITNKELEYYRVGCCVRISEEQLQNYLNRNCVKPQEKSNAQYMSSPCTKTGSKGKKKTASEPDLRHYVPGMKVV